MYRAAMHVNRKYLRQPQHAVNMPLCTGNSSRNFFKLSVFWFALVFAVCAARADDKTAAPKLLVIHEWGTFTSLQDESGNAIGGINTDDEPVPDFVHRLSPHLLIDANNLPEPEYQGAPPSHPDVTMRLETPVMYFYPPKGWRPQPVNVRVAFVGDG